MQNAKRNALILLPLIVIITLSTGYNRASAAQTSFWDDNIHADMTHPNTVTHESSFSVSTVLRGKTADNVNVTLSLAPSAAFRILGNQSFYIPQLQQDSTLGFTFELETVAGVTEGTHAINFFVNYEHKELLGDYTGQSFSNAIEIRLKSAPEIIYSIRAPDSLFAGDKFPVKVSLNNIGADANDVKVNIIPPDYLAIIGQNTHTLSKLGAGDTFDFEFELEVSEGIDEAETRLLQVKVYYLDTETNQHESTETFPLFIRPRGFLEIGAAGGVWIGPVFISLITGIGSIVSATVGFIYFVYRLKQKRSAEHKRKRKKA